MKVFEFLLVFLMVIVSVTAVARNCKPIDLQSLPSDLEDQRSLLDDAIYECPNLATAIALAKVYQQMGDSDIANEVMLDSINRDIYTDTDRGNWLVGSIEMSLKAQNTCQTSKYLNELSAYDNFKSQYQLLRKQLYQSTKNDIVNSQTIGCSLTLSRSISARGMKIRPKMDLAIHFNFNSDVLTTKGRNQAQQLANALVSGKLQNKNMALIGHTDSIGSTEYNLGLSQRRALAVQSFLVNDDSSLKTRLYTSGKGESELLSNGHSDYDNQLNRRVEIQVK